MTPTEENMSKTGSR